MNKIETCPNCGSSDWKSIPDSLAEYCVCGFVRVQTGDGHLPGYTIQKWLRDVYGDKDVL
jgi:hypothetical protein